MAGKDKFGNRAKKGTPLKLSPELLERVVVLIQNGCYIETAAGACGIPRQTLWEWLKKGGEGRIPYAEFYEKVTQARDTAEVRDVVTVAKAGIKDWRAAAWRLEKMHGKRYSGIAVTENKVDIVNREEQAKALLDVYGFSSGEPAPESDPAGALPAKIRS